MIKITVVIPAYNEERYIAKTLQALSNAKTRYEKKTMNKIEVLVVNNNSSDKTALICSKYDVRLLQEKNQQIAACRNHGARVSKGEILIFLDADTIVPMNFFKIIEKNLSTQKIIGGSAKLISDNNNMISKIMYALWNIFSLLLPFKGAVLYCYRDTFFEIGGFDESFYALEDVKFSIQLKKIGKKYNKKFISNKSLSVITASRKFKNIEMKKIIKMIHQILLNPFSFYRKKEIVGCWFYSIR